MQHGDTVYKMMVKPHIPVRKAMEKVAGLINRDLASLTFCKEDSSVGLTGEERIEELDGTTIIVR